MENEDGKTQDIHGYDKHWSKWLQKGKVIY